MLSDRTKEALYYCRFGAIWTLGYSLFWLFFHPLGIYSLLRVLLLILAMICILGTIIAREGEAKGFTLCSISGIIALICGISSGWLLLRLSIYFLIIEIVGPMLIIVGGLIGYQDLRPGFLKIRANPVQKVLEPGNLSYQKDCPKCDLSRKLKLKYCSWCGKCL